jgi:hypothetical protein
VACWLSLSLSLSFWTDLLAVDLAFRSLADRVAHGRAHRVVALPAALRVALPTSNEEHHSEQTRVSDVYRAHARSLSAGFSLLSGCVPDVAFDFHGDDGGERERGEEHKEERGTHVDDGMDEFERVSQTNGQQATGACRK